MKAYNCMYDWGLPANGWIWFSAGVSNTGPGELSACRYYRGSTGPSTFGTLGKIYHQPNRGAAPPTTARTYDVARLAPSASCAGG